MRVVHVCFIIYLTFIKTVAAFNLPQPENAQWKEEALERIYSTLAEIGMTEELAIKGNFYRSRFVHLNLWETKGKHRNRPCEFMIDDNFILRAMYKPSAQWENYTPTVKMDDSTAMAKIKFYFDKLVPEATRSEYKINKFNKNENNKLYTWSYSCSRLIGPYLCGSRVGMCLAEDGMLYDFGNLDTGTTCPTIVNITKEQAEKIACDYLEEKLRWNLWHLLNGYKITKFDWTPESEVIMVAPELYYLDLNQPIVVNVPEKIVWDKLPDYTDAVRLCWITFFGIGRNPYENQFEIRVDTETGQVIDCRL
ncbi:MAG: hypothetical protein PHQ23_13580 [Candidatus Wallbacteria bacterium]|nr:hypothetical protein [Candidatus Wallbacteria bacterium]